MQVVNLHKIPELQEISVSENIVLRPLEISDANEVLEIINNDKNIRNQVTVAARLKSVSNVVSEVDSYKNDPGVIRYVIEENNTLLGLISLWRDSGFFGTNPEPNDYGFGYFIHPKARGRGIVSTCLNGLMDKVEKSLNVRQFIAFCSDDNPASQKVLTKQGFEETEQTYKEPNNGWTERKYIKKPNRT